MKKFFEWYIIIAFLTQAVNAQCSFSNFTRSVCSGVQFSAVPSLALPTHQFTWALPIISPSGAIGGATASVGPQATITQLLINSGTSPATATYTIVPSGPGCTGSQSFTLTVTVNPHPTVNTVSNQIVCSGSLTSTIQFTGPVAGTTFSSWNNDNVNTGLPDIGDGNIAPFTAQNNSLSPIQSGIYILPIANGCLGDNTLVTTITVNPRPTVLTQSLISICEGQVVPPINIQTTVPNSTVAWSHTNNALGLATSGTSNPIPSFTAGNSTNAIQNTPLFVQASNNGCTSASIQLTQIEVKPKPEVNLLSDLNVCNGAQVPATIFTGTVVNTTISQWANTDINVGLQLSGSGNLPAFTAFNPGSSPLTVTISATPIANGCQGNPTEVFDITVRPSPFVNAIDDTSVCEGVSLSLPVFSSNLSTAQFAWTNSSPENGLAANGSGNLPQFIPITSLSANSFMQVNVTASEPSCLAGPPTSFLIEIIPQPDLSFSPPSTNYCSGTPIDIQLESSVNPVVFNWSHQASNILTLSEEGSGDLLPSFEGLNSTSTDIPVEILVYASNQGCIGPQIPIDLVILPQPQITQLEDLNFCNGNVSDEIIFESNNPDDSFSWTNNNLLTGVSSSGNSSVFPVFTASNNTGSTIQSEIVVNAQGNNGCSTNMTFYVNVLLQGSTPSADFSFTVNGNEFAAALNDSIGVDSVVWNLGDGSEVNSNSISHTYAQNGTYVVSVNVIDACGQTDSYSQEIEIALSIDDLVKTVIVYPNPAQNQFRVHYSGISIQQDLITLTLSDVTGRSLPFQYSLFSENILQIEPLFSQPGTYYLCGSLNGAPFYTPILLTE
jgi:hypothetical protein